MALNLHREPKATGLTINEIPDEVLALIFLYLRPSDRLNSALTCRRWTKVMSSYDMLEGIRLSIAGSEMKAAASILSESTRRHRSLLLHNATLPGFNSMFWNAIRGSLRELELSECHWLPENLSTILRQCPRLEILRFDPEASTRNLPPDIFGELDPPDHLGVLELRFSSRGDERDTLPKGGWLHGTAQEGTRRSGIFGIRVSDPQLGVMPKVALVSLSVDYHSRVNPSTILGPRREIQKLNLNFGHSDAECSDLIRISSETVQELCIWNSDALGRDIAEAIGACTKLRRLQLVPCHDFSDHSQVEPILRNASNVEDLEIRLSSKFTGTTLSRIFKHQRLKRLCVYESLRYVSDEVLRRVGTISTLQYLELNGFGPKASVIRDIARLKNLKGLFWQVSGSLDSECFDLICESFENLEELRLNGLRDLTDADGVKLRRLKNLRKLILQQAEGFTDLTFKEGLGSPTLTKLEVWDSLLTDAGLASFASNHKMLRFICLSRCHKITDAGIISLLEREPLIREFGVHDCHSLKGRWREARGISLRVSATW